MRSRGRTKVQSTMVMNWLRKICRWPDTTKMTRADFERLLETVPPSNTTELGKQGGTRYREAHSQGLLQSMVTGRWSPMDHGPVIIAAGPMGLRIENGEHRLRAAKTAAMQKPVEMLMKLKEYKSEDEYRKSLQQHDQLVKKRTIVMQAIAAGAPIPQLGMRQHGGMTPAIFSGAICLLTEFGTRPRQWPTTYETWLRHVLPALEKPITALCEASQCDSAYDKTDRGRIEAKLYQAQTTALLLEFFKVNPRKARTFISRLMAGEHAVASDHVQKITAWMRNEAVKPSRDHVQGAWRYIMPMKLIAGWEAHCKNRVPSRRISVKKLVKIHGSELIWWPGSTMTRKLYEAGGTDAEDSDSRVA